MKHTMTILIMVTMVSIGSLGAQGIDETATDPQQVAASPSLPDGEQDLLSLLEEEKLARDVYLTLFDTWGLKIFSNIAQSEQRHMEIAASLLSDSPETDEIMRTAPGIFENEQLAALYRDLVQQGTQSLEQALVVGATIEDMDIDDLEKLLAETTDDSHTASLQALLSGSVNHLAAFTGQLKTRYTIDYEARYVEGEHMEALLAGR